MNRNFIYLINPISGTKNKEGLLKLIAESTERKQIPFQILHTNAKGDYSFLIDKIRSEKITDIIICGGDGTINQVVAALIHVDVNVGIVPMGSGNGLAFAAGIPKNPRKALEIIFKGKAEATDAFYINDRFSCMLCGLGFDAQVAHDFAAHPSRGLSTYVKLSLRHFLNAKAYKFTIDANNINFQTEAFFISIANSNQFGNNFTIAPKASLSDGLLDIVVVKKMNKFKLVFSILKQIRTGQIQLTSAKDFGEAGIQYFQTKELRIQNPGNAPLHIDGDPADSSENFNIRIIEHAFRLLRP